MELFSEIYSAYYSAVSALLSDKSVKRRDAAEIIRKKAFSESDFFIMPKLEDDNSWRFIKYKDNEFVSVLKNKPFMPLTILEKSWLKAILNDEKSRLFLDNDDIEKIQSKLDYVNPLYKKSHFNYFDIYKDGDNFTDENYINHFGTVLEAVKNQRIIEVDFTSGKGMHITHMFVPFMIEFSAKNNKFRFFAAQIKNNRTVKIVTINFSRINSVRKTDSIYPQKADMKRISAYKRCSEPVRLKIFPKRNGVERFMLEFASYEKHTEIDENTGICTALLYFDKQDETEILIRLLSFGPVIKIEAPQDFLDKFTERISKQKKLLLDSKYQKFRSDC